MARKPGQTAANDTIPQPPHRLTKGERTRALIKATIRELLAKRNLSEIVLDDICSESNLTLGSFYFQFKNKEAALEEVANDFVADFYGEILQRPPAPLSEDIRAVVNLYLEQPTDSRALMRTQYTILRSNLGVFSTWRTLRGQLLTRLADGARAERSTRNLAPRDIELLVEFFLGGLESFYENMLFARPEEETSRVSPEAIARIWHAFILSPEAGA